MSARMYCEHCKKSHEPMHGCAIDPEKYLQEFLEDAKHHFSKHDQSHWWFGDSEDDDVEGDRPTAEQMVAYIQKKTDG